MSVRIGQAVEHLADAETAVMSWISRIGESDENGEVDVDFLPMLLAIMRSIAHAAGILEGMIADDAGS